MKIFLIINLFCLALTCSAQKDELIKYLNACKNEPTEESNKIAKEYSFDQGRMNWLSEFQIENIAEFKTDLANINGFKATFDCKLKGEFEKRRILAIMYFDKIKKHWSVFSTSDFTIPESEYEAQKKMLEDINYKFFEGKENAYRSLAYWSLMAGKISEARKNINIAINENKKKKNPHFSSDDIIRTLDRIAK